MDIQPFFDKATSTLTYVVSDRSSGDAVIIDPVLDFDSASGKVSKASLDGVLSFVDQHHLRIHLILETHAHADHISGAHALVSEHFPNAKIAISEHITVVQETFRQVFNLEGFRCDGSQFDRLLRDREAVRVGSLSFSVIATPGHTPACTSFLFADAVFTGDALFMPDSGTGRCDFPEGDAKSLYHSIASRLYSLPDSTRVFVGHDYQPGGRSIAWETTIGRSKHDNIHLKANTSEEAFVEFRRARDKMLSAPRLLYPSIQVNIAAGQFPAPESNGQVYLKLPVS